MGETFPPANRCIYCGTTKGRLSREHIIPKGLNGDLILPSSSCRVCAAITSADEHTVLRKSVREARAILGYRSRRPAEVPHDIEMEFTKGTTREIRRVPLTNAVAPLPMPILEFPGCLRTGPGNARLSSTGVQVISVGQDPAKVLADNQADNVAVMAYVDVPAFARMIGKIGYSYAAAKLGHDRVKGSLVIPSLLRKNNEIGLWVGGSDMLIGKPDPIGHIVGHSVYRAPTEEGQSEVVVVVLRLFSHLGTPGYVVVLSPSRPMPIGDLQIAG